MVGFHQISIKQTIKSNLQIIGLLHNCWIYTFIGNKHLLHTYVCWVYIYIDITVVGLISGCSALHYWIILEIQKGYIGQTRSYWILKGYTGRNIVGSTYWTIWILKGQFTFIFFIEICKINFIIYIINLLPYSFGISLVSFKKFLVVRLSVYFYKVNYFITTLFERIFFDLA